MTLSKKAPLAVFLFAAAVALSFAVYTDHVWEDYYITYRSSKNLATGHGLVFNHGDRLHTFTSPLGVLLPAVASLLTANSSDTAALWIFRLMSCAALGATAAFFLRISEGENHGKLAILLIIAWLAMDSKIVDFSINGMETAFMLLFLAYALWSHFRPGPRQWLHLGGAWAGLMWTRPDSFIYIGLIAAGFWLFNEPDRTGLSRRQMFMLFLRAGCVTTVLYLPWLLFAWGYYGTPVPHTITAKSGVGDHRTLGGLFNTILHLSWWTDSGSVAGTFLPAYYMIGGWPEPFIQAGRALAVVCTLLWLLPFLRVETRAASFAFFGAHAYLSYFPYFPFPWYLPSTTVLAVFSLGSLLAQALVATKQWATHHPASARPRQITRFTVLVVALLLAGNVWSTWQSARLFTVQQKYVEDGNRRKIGEWLREHAQPGDTVFLEPLGYIGYFSGLKTYDFPGLSSREMVSAIATVGPDWVKLIYQLEPRWLVLRPQEIDRINRVDSTLLTSAFVPVQDFSVVDQLKAQAVFGRSYLEHDARFTVYRSKHPLSPPFDLSNATSPYGFSRKNLDGAIVTFAHAPSTIRVPVPRTAAGGMVEFGFEAGAYAPAPDQTDGAIFSVELRDGDTSTILATRRLDPAANPADRGRQKFAFVLPRHSVKAVLLLHADPDQTTTKDWTCWGNPEFHY